MRALVTSVALILAVCVCFPPVGRPQSKGDVALLMKEADVLRDRAVSRDELKTAAEKYVQALSLLNGQENSHQTGWVHDSLGTIYQIWSQNDKAAESYGNALHIARQTEDRKLEVRALVHLASLDLNRGRYQAAEELLTQAISSMRATGDRTSEADAIYFLAAVYRTAGRYDDAKEQYEKAIAISSSQGDKRREAESLIGLSWISLFQGESAGPLERCKRALAIAQEAQSTVSIGWAYLVLSEIHSHLGQSAEAFQAGAQALRLGSQLGCARLEGNADNRLGRIHALRHDFESANDYYERALRVAQEIGDPSLQADVIGNQGLVYLDRDRATKALDCMKRSLDLARKTKVPRIEANQLHNMGMVYRHRQQYTEAKKCYEESLKIREKLRDKRYALNSINGIGLLYMDQGNQDEAAIYFKKSLAMAQEVKDLTGEGWALNNLGEVFRRKGQYAQAEEYYNKALNISMEAQYPKLEEFALFNLSKAYLAQGNHIKAAEVFQKAQALQRKTKDMPFDPQILVGEAMGYIASGQYPKAVTTYEHALKTARAKKDARGEASALVGLGMVSMVSGRLAEAAGHYEHALKIVEKDSEPQYQALVILGLFNVYASAGQHDKAVKAYEKLMALESAIDDPTVRTTLRSAIGMLQSELFSRGVSNNFTEQALNEVRKVKDPKDRATLLVSMSQTNTNLGRNATAVKLCNEALELASSIKFPIGEAAALNVLSRAYENTGMYGKASESLERSLAISRTLHDPKLELIALNKLGGVYLTWGRYTEAATSFEQAQALANKIHDSLGQAQALDNLGEVHKALGEYESALKAYQKAQSVAEASGDSRTASISLIHCGQVYQQRGNNEEAAKVFQQGLDLCRKLRSSTAWAAEVVGLHFLDSGNIERAEPLIREANSASSLGRLYLLKSDFAPAMTLYQKMRDRAEQTRDADGLFTAYTGMGAACEGQKNSAQAFDYYNKAVKLTEDLRSTVSPEQRDRFFDVRVQGFYRTAPYEGLARVLISLNRPLDAWRISEYTKARAFAESMAVRSSSGRYDVPEELIQADASLSEQLAALKKRRQEAYEKNDKHLIAQLEPQVAGLEKQFVQHVKMLRDTYPKFAAARYPEPMDLSQTKLKDNEWALAFHVTDSGVIAYLSQGKHLKLARYKELSKKRLKAIVRRFRKPLEVRQGDSLETKLASFDFTSAEELADLLLRDVLAVLPPGAPLTIVPDDCLGAVPFEMLVLNNRGRIATDKTMPYVVDAEFFGDRNTVCYCQSVAALTLAREFAKSSEPDARMLVVSDPVFSPEDPRFAKDAVDRKRSFWNMLSSLFMSVEDQTGLDLKRLRGTGELAKALKSLDEKHTDVFTGMAATKEILFDRPLDRYRSLVLATHGYFGKDFPSIQEPVLVFTMVNQPEGRDGLLRQSEVLRLRLRCDIVVLTACQSGLGQHVSGEGTMGMGRAFQYAGSRSVLMSLWSVLEKSSVQLTDRFFRHLKAGKSKIEALNLARQDIRKSGYDHPFFWAAFILVGEAN